jgi:myosin-5
MKFEDDYVSAFWLANCFELLCIIKTRQDRSVSGAHLNTPEALAVLEKIKEDLDYLIGEIFYGWIKELKKRISNMIVPAVIENQSLPAYICKQGGGIWGQWGKTATNSQFTVEQLLNFLSKLAKTMKWYYLEDAIGRQITTELMRIIGISSFNHLMMRKNFCTWKRGNE